MSDYEQRATERRQLPTAHAATPVPNAVPAQGASQFQSFPAKRLAMQQLLRTVSAQRSRAGSFRNPWAGWTEDQFDEYTRHVIKRLEEIRTRDLSVAYAICLEGIEGENLPEERLEDLQLALGVAQERHRELSGPARKANEAYQDQLKRDIRVFERIVKNRAEMRGDIPENELQEAELQREAQAQPELEEELERRRGQEVERERKRRLTNISTLLLDAEMPGYARVYMALVAPSSSDEHKDLKLDENGRIVGLSKQIWLNFGSPGRAISYINSYRAQMIPGAMPVVRSFLVPIGFLEKYWAESVTEHPKELDAMRNGFGAEKKSSRTDNRQEKIAFALREDFMNTDSKFANQFGLAPGSHELTVWRKADPGGSKRGADQWSQQKTVKKEWIDAAKAAKSANFANFANFANRRADPSQPTIKRDFDFSTIVSVDNPVFRAMTEAALPGSFVTYSNLEEFGELHDESVDGGKADLGSLASSIALSESGVNVLRGGDNSATPFSVANRGKASSPSNDELARIVAHANAIFEALDRLPHDNVLDQEAIEAVAREVSDPLADLLEANRLTPAAVMKPKGGLKSRQRDRYGNSAILAAFEKAFADQYLKSQSWTGHMANWSRSLAASVGALDPRPLEKLNANFYIAQDVKALRNMEEPIQASSPLEVLEEMGRRDWTRSGENEPYVDLLFHVLRELGNVNADLKADRPESALFDVNNRVPELSLFDLINPSLSAQIGKDPMRSSNRFKPNRSETTDLMRDLDVPFVGGVSGTTRDYNNMRRAVFGAMDEDEFWRFQMLNTAFMVKHGYHSMFETLYPASFYEPVRGRLIRDEYGKLMRSGPRENTVDFYEPALKIALGEEEGQALWKAAQGIADRAMTPENE